MVLPRAWTSVSLRQYGIILAAISGGRHSWMTTTGLRSSGTLRCSQDRQAAAGHHKDIMVVDKEQKKNEVKKTTTPGAEGKTWTDVEGKVQSGCSGKRSVSSVAWKNKKEKLSLVYVKVLVIIKFHSETSGWFSGTLVAWTIFFTIRKHIISWPVSLLLIKIESQFDRMCLH